MGQQNILLRWSHGASIISLRSFQGSPILPFLLLTDYSDETHVGIMNDRATPVPNEILRRQSISWGNVFMIPRRLGKHRDVLLMVVSCFSITSFCVFFSKRGRRYCRGQQMKLLRLRLYNGQVSLMFLTNLLISNVFAVQWRTQGRVVITCMGNSDAQLIYEIFNFAIVQFIDYLVCHLKHCELVFIYLPKPFVNGLEPC